MKLTKERISALLRETFPAIEARVLQVMLNGYLHTGNMWYAIHHNKIRLSYWGYPKFEALIEQIKTEEEANNGEI